MHVGLNLVYLVPGETGGTETYARELIPKLVEAAPHMGLTAFVNREAARSRGAPWGELIPAVTVPVSARHRAQWVWGEQALLPRLAARARVDLLHSLANTAPGWGRYRRVVTIHDLAYRIMPEAHLGLKGLGMRLLVPIAAKRADRIIVDAQSTGMDLKRFLGVEAEKTDVVPLGVRVGATPPTPVPDTREELRVGDRPIVLSVSAKRPHKNLVRLIRALSLIDPERRPLLVLAGYSTPHEDDLRREAEQLALASDVRFLDWVSAEALEGLYAAATCFVFPSLYEGFGLPVLEAMARGVPVACSDRGSLSEVAGAAALLFDPHSEQQIADAIEHLLTDHDESDRLRAAGRARAAQFTWEATAAGTLTAYERALSSPR